MEERKFVFEYEYGANTDLTDGELEVYDILNKLLPTLPAPGSNKVWTPEIKKAIGQLGVDKGFEVYPSFHNSELLYDLVWCAKKENNLESVKLILESELSNRPNHHGLKWDFEKLLIGNAEMRVMICFNYASYNKNDPAANMINVIKWFNDCCKNFKKTGKVVRVLVIIYDDCGTGEAVPHVIII